MFLVRFLQHRLENQAVGIIQIVTLGLAVFFAFLTLLSAPIFHDMAWLDAVYPDKRIKFGAFGYVVKSAAGTTCHWHHLGYDVVAALEQETPWRNDGVDGRTAGWGIQVGVIIFGFLAIGTQAQMESTTFVPIIVNSAMLLLSSVHVGLTGRLERRLHESLIRDQPYDTPRKELHSRPTAMPMLCILTISLAGFSVLLAACSWVMREKGWVRVEPISKGGRGLVFGRAKEDEVPLRERLAV